MKIGEAIPVSSVHNLGILDVEAATEKILKKLKWKKEKPRKKNETAIAVAGKPNVGKSSLVNAFLGEPRLIVSDKPGTTIDATDTPFRFDSHEYLLIDTAGLRRRGKISKGIERYGVLRALNAISRSDVTCLVLDAGIGLTNQDLHVSEYILEAGKGLIVAINKSDLMEDQMERKKLLDLLTYRMSYMPWAPVIFISALKKKNIFRILELARNITSERRKKIADAQFKIFLKTTILSHPPTRSGRKIIFYEGRQSDVEPPTFTFICNHPDLIHFSYRRFLENEIRRHYGFHGTAIKLQFKKE
ncbi:ribosome biogenesis GTPase Der [Candidatus Peregrinibacteria bacterium]|nr:ribosome biogenesis GTPase Der [Candidatus Peregrinibacteria bacterium]